MTGADPGRGKRDISLPRNNFLYTKDAGKEERSSWIRAWPIRSEYVIEYKNIGFIKKYEKGLVFKTT